MVVAVLALLHGRLEALEQVVLVVAETVTTSATVQREQQTRAVEVVVQQTLAQAILAALAAQALLFCQFLPQATQEQLLDLQQ